MSFLTSTEWWNGGMVEWWNGGMVEWWNGGMVEWWNGGQHLRPEIWFHDKKVLWLKKITLHHH